MGGPRGHGFGPHIALAVLHAHPRKPDSIHFVCVHHHSPLVLQSGNDLENVPAHLFFIFSLREL